MNADQLKAYLTSGMEGSNPFIQGQQERQTKTLEAKLAPTTAGKKQAAENEANTASLNDPRVQNLVNEGGSAKVGDISLGGNPYAKLAAQGPHEAKSYQGIVDKAFKPINDSLDASKATLDNLNMGNSTGDQLALINEAKLSLAGSGGRAIGQMVSHLSGDPTMAGDAQKALNWLQNTPNVPKMQPAQRDAIRESIFNRLDQTEQMGTQQASSLAQQGPALAPHSDYGSILGAYTTPATQKLKALRQAQQQYQQQRQQMQPQPNVSSPSTADANPTMLDRLKNYFSPTKAPAAQPQAPQQTAPQPQTMKVKHLQSGQTGTIPSAEFDPKIYSQVQ